MHLSGKRKTHRKEGYGVLCLLAQTGNNNHPNQARSIEDGTFIFVECSGNIFRLGAAAFVMLYTV